MGASGVGAEPAAWRRTTAYAVALLRLGGAILGMTAVHVLDLGASGTRSELVQVVLAALAMSSLVTLGLVSRLADRDLQRLSALTFALDAVLLSLPALILAPVDPPIATTLLSLLLLEGALQYQLAGAGVAVAVVITEETVRQTLRVSVWDLDPAWAVAGLVVGFAVIVSAAVGWIARDSEVRRQTAEREAHRAELMAAQTAASSRQVTAMHRVVLAGIAGVDAGALDRMVAEIAIQLEIPHVTIVLQDDARLIVGATTIPGLTPQGTVVLADHGAVRQALAGGAATIGATGSIDPLSEGPPAMRSELAAPLRLHGEAIGVLVIGSPEPGVFGPDDLGSTQRLADQVGVVVGAARAYEREAALVDEYRTLDRMKTDFVAITSHELRTPLTAVLGFTETLLRTEIGFNARTREQLLGTILQHARRLERLVDDLGTISRIDRGQLGIDLADVALHAAVHAVHEGLVPGQDVRVEGDDVVVRADVDRLHQVLSNLVLNAFDHGGSAVTVTCGSDGTTARVAVQDDGPGVAPEHRDAIFDRFYQAGDSMEHSRGSGLGLPIAAELVRAMGGELWLDTSAEGGARFILELPVVEPV